MNVKIDFDRAKLLFDRLVQARTNQQYPYDRIKVPQRKENLPSQITWGSVDHARFLFCACYYMRGGIQSETAIKCLSALYEKEPELFNPLSFAPFEMLYEEAEIQLLLKEHRLGYQSETISRQWIFNFAKLRKYWKSDPAQLYTAVMDYDLLCNIIIGPNKRTENDPKGFKGFQHKMVSMLTYFLMHANIINRLAHPVPVDFHILRLLVSHEILSPPDNETDIHLETFQSAARSLTMKYCLKYGVDELVLCDALWLFSNYMCSQHPGNMSAIGKRQGRSTSVEPKEYHWSKSRESTYLATCGSCAVSDTCKFQIPAGHYYVQGKLVRRGLRSDPPQMFMSFK